MTEEEMQKLGGEHTEFLKALSQMMGVDIFTTIQEAEKKINEENKDTEDNPGQTGSTENL